MENPRKNSPASRKVIEVTGILIPVEWDDNANPIQFALSAYDEQEYLLENLTAICNPPYSILRKKIKVTGELGRKVKKRKLLTVSRFDLLEDDPLEKICQS